MTLKPEDIDGEYIRLRADSSVHSFDTQDVSAASSSFTNIHLPTTSSSVHYVPKKNISRYRPAWRTVIPYRQTKRSAFEVPLDKVGLFSYITSCWMRSFFRESWNPSLPKVEITGSISDSSDTNGQRFHFLLSEENVRSGQLNSSMCRVVWLFVRTRVILASIMSLLGYFISICGLVLFYHLFLSEIDSNQKHFGGLPLSMCISAQIIALFLQSGSTNLTHRTAVRLRSAFMSVMYSHLMRVSVLNDLSVQQVVTMMATDSQMLFHAIIYLPAVIISPFVVLYCSFIIVWCIYDAHSQKSPNEAVYLRAILIILVAGFFIFLLLFMLAKAAGIFKSRAGNSAAQRLATLQNMLSHVRLAKMTSWEKIFNSQAKDLRKKECNLRGIANVFGSIGVSLLHTAPAIIAILLCYASDPSIMDTNYRQKLQLQFILVLVLVLIFIKDSFQKFWLGINRIFVAMTSLEKLKSVLLLEKTKQSSEKPANRLIAVAISQGKFGLESRTSSANCYRSRGCLCCRKYSAHSYEIEKDEDIELQEKPVLNNISFSAPKGKLIGICGTRVSGKTSLLLAILGHFKTGFSKMLFRDGTFSYVSQNPWIWDTTLRNNILFNETFDHKRYYQAIHCCSLNEFIQYLPGGDETKLYGRSLLLGQRQRIALARALYSCRDICLFDDILSSVEPNLASEIFDKAILGHLKQKTVIITTQRSEFLRHCTEIFLLDEGEIIAHGSYDELLSETTELFAAMLENTGHDPLKRTPLTPGTVQNIKCFDKLSSDIINFPQVIMEQDDLERRDSLVWNKSQSTFLMKYIKKVSSLSWLLVSIILSLFYLLFAFASPLSCLWIRNNSCHQECMYWITIAILPIIVLSISGYLTFHKVMSQVSLTIHNTWLDRICNTSLAFFQDTVVFDITRWFSVCLQRIDMGLPSEVFNALQQFLLVSLSCLGLLLISLWLLIPLGLIATASILLCCWFRSRIIKLQNLEEESCKPLYIFIASTLTGRATIQAYGKENDYSAMFVKHCDTNAACTQLMSGAMCWFTYWMQAIVVTVMALFLILIVNARFHEFDKYLFIISPINKIETTNLMGISILCLLLLGNALQYGTESFMKIITWSSMLTELDKQIKKISSINNITEESDLPANWPTNGRITFQNVKLKYWSYPTNFCNGITFTIQANETVGILNIPGSQQQFIVDVLFSLVELSHGSISIGGTDISIVPQDKLRASIALIPPDPVFFAGTLKQNMDPEGQYADSDLIGSLQNVFVWDAIQNLPGGINTKVENIEESLSDYQHRLIYVACAILKDPKVLILEEPTSNKDYHDITIVKDMIRNLFTSTTVLIVSQQATSLLKCDKIAVIQDGQMVEYDTPEKLFRNSQSNFSRMLTLSTRNLFETSL